MKRLFLFFDFDGVLFHTLDEAYVLSVLAWEGWRDPETVEISGARHDFFRQYRYLCGPASDFWGLFQYHADRGNKPVDVVELKKFIKGAALSQTADFAVKYYESRERLIRENNALWNRLNTPFPFLDDFRALLRNHKEKVYIVSTKEKETIQKLLDRHNCSLFQNHILGREFFEKFKSKRKVLEMVLDIGSADRGLFVDDGEDYIREVQDWDKIQAFQPSWGYVGPDASCVTREVLVREIKKALVPPKRVKTGFPLYGLENRIMESLFELKEAYGAEGIKAEFEAEGASFRDLVRLRRLTLASGLGLFLKVGGPEAMRDIRDSLELGVDGLIVPMVESAFGIVKFKEAFRSVYKNHRVHLSFNLETKTAVENIESILEEASDFFDNVTIGRTDLTRSYGKAGIVPDSPQVFEIIEETVKLVRAKGLSTTVGGSLSLKSLEAMRTRPWFLENIPRIETRKVVLNTVTALADESGLQEAIAFEELYILSKKEIQELFMEPEVNRLTKLMRRV